MVVHGKLALRQVQRQLQPCLQLHFNIFLSLKLAGGNVVQMGCHPSDSTQPHSAGVLQSWDKLKRVLLHTKTPGKIALLTWCSKSASRVGGIFSIDLPRLQNSSCWARSTFMTSVCLLYQRITNRSTLNVTSLGTLSRSARIRSKAFVRSPYGAQTD